MLRRLHSDTRAQVSFLGLVGAFALIGMLAMIMNTGDVLRHRMHMQSTADVTAISAATWTARGMNTVAMINVLNTKLLSMTVITNAAQKTVEVLIPIAQGQSIAFAACSGVPIVGAFCIAMKVVVDIQLGVLQSVLKPVLTTLKNSVTACPKVAWKVMEGLSKAAEVIAISFPKIGYAEGMSIANINGATSGFVVEGSALRLGSDNLSEFARLPVSKDDAALNDFCGPMLSGGKGFELQGYPEGVGPTKHGKSLWDTAWYAFVNLFAHPIFYGFYRTELTWMQCGVEDGEESGQRVDFYHLDDCRQHEATAKWTRYSDRTDWLDHNHWRPEDFIAWVPSGGGGGGLSPAERAGFGGLEDLSGESISIPGGAINHRPRGQGVDALTGQSRAGTYNRDCSSSASSGYPRVGGYNLKNNPDYMHFEVDESGFHSRAATDRREATGTYFLKVSTETQYRGDVPIDDDGDGVEDRTVERVYSDLQWNLPAGVPFSVPASERPYLSPEYQYVLDIFSLTSAGQKTLEGEELDEYLEEEYGADMSQGSSHGGGQCGTYPKPHLMVDADSTPDKLRYFSVAIKTLGPDEMPFWSRYFDQTPNRYIAFSQAQVYNELSADTFTQDWRVRLERATLLNSALERAGELGLGPIAGAAGEIIDTVNNH